MGFPALLTDVDRTALRLHLPQAHRSPKDLLRLPREEPELVGDREVAIQGLGDPVGNSN